MDYIIIEVSWITQLERNYDTKEENEKIYQLVKTFINFLQENGLTTKTILPEEEAIKDETCIRTSDLTDTGRIFFKKKHFDKWMGGIIDKGKDPNDTAPLKKVLDKISSQ